MDEMKITANTSFDQNNLKMMGFVDLGKFTEDKQKNEPGDHALVFMFQPFQGILKSHVQWRMGHRVHQTNNKKNLTKKTFSYVQKYF